VKLDLPIKNSDLAVGLIKKRNETEILVMFRRHKFNKYKKAIWMTRKAVKKSEKEA